MRYLVIETWELRAIGQEFIVDQLLNMEDVDHQMRYGLVGYGDVKLIHATFWIPETNRYYDLLRYANIGWIKSYAD